MPRTILPESQIHPAVREKIATYRTDMLKEVQAAVAANDIVVVGMRMNPFPKKARQRRRGKRSMPPGSRTSTSSTAAISANGAGASSSRCGPAGPPFPWCS